MNPELLAAMLPEITEEIATLEAELAARVNELLELKQALMREITRARRRPSRSQSTAVRRRQCGIECGITTTATREGGRK